MPATLGAVDAAAVAGAAGAGPEQEAGPRVGSRIRIRWSEWEVESCEVLEARTLADCGGVRQHLLRTASGPEIWLSLAEVLGWDYDEHQL